MTRRGYRLQLRWPIARGWFEPMSHGDGPRSTLGFIKPWHWVRDYSVYLPPVVVDMSMVPALDDAPSRLYDFLRSRDAEHLIDWSQNGD